MIMRRCTNCSVGALELFIKDFAGVSHQGHRPRQGPRSAGVLVRPQSQPCQARRNVSTRQPFRQLEITAAKADDDFIPFEGGAKEGLRGGGGSGPEGVEAAGVWHADVEIKSSEVEKATSPRDGPAGLRQDTGATIDTVYLRGLHPPAAETAREVEVPVYPVTGKLQVQAKAPFKSRAGRKLKRREAGIFGRDGQAARDEKARTDGLEEEERAFKRPLEGVLKGEKAKAVKEKAAQPKAAKAGQKKKLAEAVKSKAAVKVENAEGEGTQEEGGEYSTVLDKIKDLEGPGVVETKFEMTEEEVERRRKAKKEAYETMKKEKAAVKAHKAKKATQLATKNLKSETWMTQKAALEKKFGEEGWKPRKRLSPDTLEGIRALHASDPETYDTSLLSDHFKVTPEAIRRILKSKWKANEVETADRRGRWERRGVKKWEEMAALGMRPPSKWRAMGIGSEKGTKIEKIPKRVKMDNEGPLSWDDVVEGLDGRESLAGRIL